MTLIERLDYRKPYSRFWNGLSAGFRRFWKQRHPIEMFRIEAYMTVVGLPSALKIYILKLCTSHREMREFNQNLVGIPGFRNT